MATPPISLDALNREILLNPASAGSNELVALLELEKPDLEFLCPLARAIYLLETNRQGSIDVNGVLGSLWLIDESEARGTEYGEDFACVNEVVHHSIITAFGEIKINLGFESSTLMVHYKELWPEYLRMICAHSMKFDLAAEHSYLIEHWFAGLDAETKSSRTLRGYPTDSGEFIGSSSYALTSVNGLLVNGPSFSDTYHDQSWDGLNKDYPQRWVEGGEDSCFCWLHYLSRDQAEQIGIAAKGRKALGPDKAYPEWAPKKLVDDLDDQWNDSDQIGNSYGEGNVIIESSTEAYIAAGCGAEWDPSNPESQLDVVADGCEEFPGNAAPLLKIDINRNAEQLPAELKNLLPYLVKLRKLI